MVAVEIRVQDFIELRYVVAGSSSEEAIDGCSGGGSAVVGGRRFICRWIGATTEDE